MAKQRQLSEELRSLLNSLSVFFFYCTKLHFPAISAERIPLLCKSHSAPTAPRLFPFAVHRLQIIPKEQEIKKKNSSFLKLVLNALLEADSGFYESCGMRFDEGCRPFGHASTERAQKPRPSGIILPVELSLTTFPRSLLVFSRYSLALWGLLIFAGFC